VLFYGYQDPLRLGSGGGTINTTANNNTFLSGVITGTGSLTASGPGTLQISGSGNVVFDNTYTGGTLIQSGAYLQVGDNSLNRINIGSGSVTLDGGTLAAESGQH